MARKTKTYTTDYRQRALGYEDVDYDLKKGSSDYPRTGGEKADHRITIDDRVVQINQDLRVLILDKETKQVDVEKTNQARIKRATEHVPVITDQFRYAYWRNVSETESGLLEIEYKLQTPHRIPVFDNTDFCAPRWAAQDFLKVDEEELIYMCLDGRVRPKVNPTKGLIVCTSLNELKDLEERTDLTPAEVEEINATRARTIVSNRALPIRVGKFRLISYDRNGLLRMSYHKEAPEELVTFEGEEEFSLEISKAAKYLGTISSKDLRQMVNSGELKFAGRNKVYLSEINRLKQNIPKVELPTPTKSIFGDDIPEDMDGGDIEDVTADPIDRDILRQ